MSAVATETGRPAAPVDAPATPDWGVLMEPLPDTTRGSIAFAQSVGSAVDALLGNKMRALLTMLGIIIGVGAVIVMIALGEGASRSVQARLAGLGTNMLTINPGSGFGPGNVQGGAGSRQTLTEPDALAIQKQVAGVALLTPSRSANATQVQVANKNWNTTVRAYYPSVFQIQSWQIARGAAFDQSDQDGAALVAVIGQTVATNLFGDADPVGQTVLVRNVAFKVKGVLAPKGSNGFQDQDDVVLIPFSTGQIRLFPLTYVQEIAVQVADAEQMATVQQQITDLLRTRHRLAVTQQNDFNVRNNNQIIDTVQGTSDTMRYLLAGVAAVSLIVGGIGIMNIMLVSVTERIREIGIRMAIGARPGNILAQFLIEAVLLSLAGGVIGIGLGVGGSLLLSRLAGWTTAVTWPAIAMSFGFAALVGVFFGFYPARSASKLDPIEALRYD
ncbi:MAG TPA: ABC transporter permease [Chloroflexota bacterium]|nr:ABC transporter permease [Chloroflexota bacterium]